MVVFVDVDAGLTSPLTSLNLTVSDHTGTIQVNLTDMHAAHNAPDIATARGLIRQ